MSWAHRDLQELQDNKAQEENLVHQELRVQGESQDCKEVRVPLARPDQEERLDKQGPKDLLVPLGQRVLLDNQDHRGREGSQVLQADQDLLDR